MSDLNNNINTKNVDNQRKPYLKKGHKGFLLGNPGRPEGCKNRYTLLKDRILEEAQKRNWGKVSTSDMLKIAAGILPKEQKIEHSGEGFTVKLVDFSSACNLKEKDARDPDTK